MKGSRDMGKGRKRRRNREGVTGRVEGVGKGRVIPHLSD